MLRLDDGAVTGFLFLGRVEDGDRAWGRLPFLVFVRQRLKMFVGRFTGLGRSSKKVSKVLDAGDGSCLLNQLRRGWFLRAAFGRLI
jgi:hypothetical protein